jgi:hypothetical protein
VTVTCDERLCLRRTEGLVRFPHLRIKLRIEECLYTSKEMRSMRFRRRSLAARSGYEIGRVISESGECFI